MNVIELLKKDHQNVNNLFAQFDQLKEQPEKNKNKLEKLYATIKSELELHTSAEEKFFYPELEDKEDTHEIVLESIEEHHVVKLLLKELDKKKDVDERWIAKMSVMKENVQHHVREEEKELFQKAAEILDEDMINEIGDSIAQLKKAA